MTFLTLPVLIMPRVDNGHELIIISSPKLAEGCVRAQHEHGSAVLERRSGQQLRPAARPAEGEGRGRALPLRQLDEQGVQRRHEGTRGEQGRTAAMVSNTY